MADLHIVIVTLAVSGEAQPKSQVWVTESADAFCVRTLVCQMLMIF